MRGDLMYSNELLAEAAFHHSWPALKSRGQAFQNSLNL